MSKIYILFLFLFSYNYICGQTDSTSSTNKYFSFALFLGNNGQVDKSIIDFYSSPYEDLYFVLKVQNKVQHELKYNLKISLNTQKHTSFGLKVGFQPANRSYVLKDSFTEYIDANAKQYLYNLNLSIEKSISFKKFKFYVGIEAPFYLLGNYFYQDNRKHYRNNTAGIAELQYEIENDVKIDGGYIVGINSQLSIQYYFIKRAYLSIGASAGIMYANVGNSIETEENILYLGSNAPTTRQRNTDYVLKKTYFSEPELGIGIGITF